jgi:hypothetical protein
VTSGGVIEDEYIEPAPGEKQNSTEKALPNLPATFYRGDPMKRIVIPFALVTLLGCAGPTPPGVLETQAMTDMDGRPIDPGRTGTGGVGFGIGAWGGRGGGGVGFGMGW